MEHEMFCARCGKSILNEPQGKIDFRVDLQVELEVETRDRFSTLDSTRHLCRLCSYECIHWLNEKTNK